MTDAKPGDWSAEAILQQLQAAAGGPQGAAAQLFFTDAVADDDLHDATRRVIAEAGLATGRAPDVRIGRVSKLARSVAVEGDPEVIVATLRDPRVLSVLPADIADSFPRPFPE